MAVQRTCDISGGQHQGEMRRAMFVVKTPQGTERDLCHEDLAQYLFEELSRVYGMYRLAEGDKDIVVEVRLVV